MAIEDVARGLAGLCAKGQFDEAMTQYYSDDIVSVEPHGEPAEVHGMNAVKAKSDWWSNNFEVHGAKTAGPFINGNQFAVEFEIDTTNKQSGERSTLKEIAVYTVKNDKIVHERFYNLAK